GRQSSNQIPMSSQLHSQSQLSQSHMQERKEADKDKSGKKASKEKTVGNQNGKKSKLDAQSLLQSQSSQPQTLSQSQSQPLSQSQAQVSKEPLATAGSSKKKPKSKIKRTREEAELEDDPPAAKRQKTDFSKDKVSTSTISRPPSQVEKQIASKPKRVDPEATIADKFPYSGPVLTNMKPATPAYPIVVPSYARWFRLDRIHSIEYQSLSDLFANKGMHHHQRYLEIRNFIVNSFRMNPR
ncbi:hypothetical protein RFI_29566, partial [Reticulomyxa filosa]